MNARPEIDALDASAPGLMGSRHFAPFFWTQALGAFNDNVYKQLLLLLLTFVAVPMHGWDAGLVNNLAAGLFILPFLLFSAWGGALADAVDKRRLIRALKWLELMTMLAAAVMIWFQAFVALLSLLFLAGVQAALFGPVKYAILPQHVPRSRLVNANAWVEMGTFMAILLGTLLAGGLVALPEGISVWAMGATLVLVSLCGLIAGYQVPSAPPVSSHRVTWRPLKLSREVLSSAWRQPRIFRALLGISIFWLLGTSYLTQLPLWVDVIIGGDGGVVSFLLAAFAIGIGLGSLLCARLSAGRLEVGLIPLGALLIALGGFDFAHHSPLGGDETLRGLGELVGEPRLWWMFADLVLIGIGGGLYIVPLYLIVQIGSDEGERARMIAANNVLNALFMILAAGLGILVLSVLGASLNWYFTLIAAISLAVGVTCSVARPRPLLRICIFIALRLGYRLSLEGRRHIPDSGPAIVVCNHVSYMDALMLGGTSPRPLRFMMDSPAYESPWINWFCRIVGAIPVDLDKRSPTDLRRALNEVSMALRNGEVVMLFPEGRLTRDGSVNEFRRGVELILRRDPVPVVPAAISGLWGSWGSYHAGRPFKRWPSRLRRRVRLGFGAPLPATCIDRHHLRLEVVRLKQRLDEQR